MTHIEARLAARIDRLARAAHRFHRFSHHPLCDDYGGEVIRLGRRNRVCRGCLFVAIGSLAGIAVSVSWRVSTATLVLAWAIGLAAFALTLLGRPKTFERRIGRKARGTPIRTPKLASRFFPAFAVAFALGTAMQAGVAARVIAAVAAVPLFALVAMYRRRGPDRTPCATCPERNLAKPCRGIAPIVRRERAFRRLAGQWLARSAAQAPRA